MKPFIFVPVCDNSFNTLSFHELKKESLKLNDACIANRQLASRDLPKSKPSFEQ